MPSKVMIIRHGEKPKKKGKAPFGMTEQGEKDFESLTARGWQRAGALVSLFDPARSAGKTSVLAPPDAIFASSGTTPGDKKTGSKSARPLQTVLPLARKLGITPNVSFAKGQEKKVARSILRQKGAVLVSWQHESIHFIVEALAGPRGTEPPIPPQWCDDRFDVVWVLTPRRPGRWKFTQVAQRLLEGDKATPIGTRCP
jgi:hypothetical protein